MEFSPEGWNGLSLDLGVVWFLIGEDAERRWNTHHRVVPYCGSPLQLDLVTSIMLLNNAAGHLKRLPAGAYGTQFIRVEWAELGALEEALKGIRLQHRGLPKLFPKYLH